jgi:hypothetical protein
MKKIFAILFASLYVITAQSQTTQEEYNYVTKGYKVQVESGLDMKKGYIIKDLDMVSQTASNGTTIRQASLKKLTKTSTNEAVAFMIVYQRAGKVPEYFCIPSPTASQELRDAFYVSLTAADALGSTDKLQLITLLLSRSLRW